MTPVIVLSLAATLKLERPHRTAAQVRWIRTEILCDAPSESTLLRHFRTLEIPTGTQAQATGRFEAARPNEIWVGDGLHGPKIGRRKIYLFAFLDDHSRMVTAPAGRSPKKPSASPPRCARPCRPTESPILLSRLTGRTRPAATRPRDEQGPRAWSRTDGRCPR